jgi:hypothetical protein
MLVCQLGSSCCAGCGDQDVVGACCWVNAAVARSLRGSAKGAVWRPGGGAVEYSGMVREALLWSRASCDSFTDRPFDHTKAPLTNSLIFWEGGGSSVLQVARWGQLMYPGVYYLGGWAPAAGFGEELRGGRGGAK